MKRILLVSALLLASVSLFAAKPFKVTKGNLNVFKADTTATWVIDLSESQFVNNGIFAKENKGDFKTWCEDDYDERVRLMDEAFFDAFNIYSPGMQLVKEGDAPYKVILKVNTFERSQGPGVMGSCYISIYGTLTVLDAATGETAVEVQVNNVKGDTDFVETDRFPKTMKWFCRDLFKQVK
ncbi:MAG: hypothetical protein J6P56_01320 [Bacteroidales bacterium]|jgi:hypothetical protein|nr:hypothetical protein [Bacteroidales bacterium]